MNTGSIKAVFVHLAPIVVPLGATSLVQFPDGSFQAIWYISILVPALLSYLPAVIVRLSRKSTDFERRHSTTFLNLQISLLIYFGLGIGAYLAIFNSIEVDDSTSYQGINSPIGQLTVASVLLVLVFISVIAALMFRAASAAYRGQDYTYPIAIRFLK
jgi:uncharacterized Tic20 family protein